MPKIIERIVTVVGILLASWLILGPEIPAAEAPVVEAVKVVQAPRIDGDLSDPCWQKAAQVPDFLQVNQEEPAKVQTKALLAYDDQALYVAFRCLEPNPAKLVATAKPSNLDAPLSRDDVIEVFISPGRNKGAYYHFMVNPANARRDQRNWGSPYIHDDTWEGEWQSATRIGAREWTVEIAIPWYNFALDLGSTRWLISLCRAKRTEPAEYSSWPYLAGSFHKISNYALLKTPQVDFARFQGLKVYDLAVARYGVEEVGYSYLVTGLIKNEQDAPRRILVEAEDIPAVGKRSHAETTVELPAVKGIPFEIKVPMESLGPRRLGLRLRDPETREVIFWASLSASHYPQLMEGYLDRNYYTREKQARAIFDLYLPAGKEQFTAELEVRPKGKKAIKVQAKVQDPRKTVIPLALSQMPLGTHPALLRVLDNLGRVIAETKATLRREHPAPPPIREVKVDHERLVALVDGKPFFPLGFYGVQPEYMKEVAEAGFNCTGRWYPGSTIDGSHLKKAREISEEAGRELLITDYLDACQEAGLLVIEFPSKFAKGYGDLRLSYANPKFAEYCARFMEDPLPFIVETASKHPAILAYSGLDEPSEQHRAQSREYSQIVSKIDPYHPNLVNFCGLPKVWPEVYDIVGMDWYGINKVPANRCLRAVQPAAAGARRLRIPYWHIPLCECRGSGGRSVSAPEQRIQGYLSVIGGANGIIWWVWPPRHRDNWEELKKLAREFKALTPVLVEATPEQTIRYQPPEMADAVTVLVKEHAGKTHLITANMSEHPADATFALPEQFSGQAKVWFENRAIDVRGFKFRDHFARLGTHVYEIGGGWPRDGVLTIEVALRVEEKPEQAAAPEVPPGANLLSDPGFETDRYWVADPGDPKREMVTCKFEKTMARNGKQCAVIRRPHGEGRATFSGWSVRLKPNTRYLFGCYARAEGGGGAEASIYLQGRSQDTWYLRSATKIRIADRSPAWDRYSIEVTTRDRPVSVRPICAFQGGTGTALFDDAFLVEVPAEAASRNLVPNSGFEQETLRGWPDNWRPVFSMISPGFIGTEDAIWGSDHQVAFEGKKSLRSMVTEKPAPRGFHYQFRTAALRLGEEKQYTLSLYMKADRPKFAVNLYMGKETKQVGVSTEWARYTFTTKLGQIAYINIMPRSQGTLWVDAVQLEEGTEATAYMPGKG